MLDTAQEAITDQYAESERVKRVFVLAHDQARQRAIDAVEDAPQGFRVVIEPPKRSNNQNDLFHDLCGALAKARTRWAGAPRSQAQWKVLLVSAHAVVTKQGSEMVPGLEGEFVNLRESTASMTKARASSLIDYAMAFCISRGVSVE